VEYDSRSENGVTVLALRGPIDVSQAYELRDVLGSLVDGSSARVLLDMGEVTLIDSSGIGLLVTAHRRAVESGAGLVIARPVAPVKRVFGMTRTDRLLRIVPTVEEGLAALDGG
jgi:anti-sigma B factor antagonist